MRIGLVSDTHSLNDAELLDRLRGVDLILHAGDIGSPSVLEGLAAVAPVLAVPGNNDDAPITRWLAEPLTARICGLTFVVVHRAGKPRALDADVVAAVRRLRPDVLVFGHSHQPGHALEEGMLRVNPGAAGPKRFSLPRCAAILTIGHGCATLRYFELAGPRNPRGAPHDPRSARTSRSSRRSSTRGRSPRS